MVFVLKDFSFTKGYKTLQQIGQRELHSADSYIPTSQLDCSFIER